MDGSQPAVGPPRTSTPASSGSLTTRFASVHRPHPTDVAPHELALLFAVIVRRSIWFIRLRWFVPPAMALATLTARGLGLELDTAGVLWVAAAILSYNVVFSALRYRVLHGAPEFVENFTRAQVTLDYLAMFALIHFTGGFSSPVVVFFLFHIILAAILLPARTAWVFSFLAVVGVAAITVWHYATGVQHAIRYQGASFALTTEPRLIAVALLFFAAAVFTTAFLSTTILRALRLNMLDLAQSRAALEQVSAARDRFMLHVTHNLRAPVAASVSFVELLEGDYLGTLNDKQREYLGRLDRRLHGMLDMITELLLVARHRNEVRQMQRGPVDLAAMATRIHQGYSERARQKGLELRLELRLERPGEPQRLTVLGDERLIEQSLENLVSNAIKYTTAGHVTLAVTREGDRVVARVEDTGIGVPAAELPKLFTEFFRARNAKALDVGGTGLGLSTVKQTIEQHGGSVSVQSTEGKGSTFTVTLPASSAPAAPPSR